MARISKKMKEENRLKFDQIILDIYYREGWEFVTFDRLAKETGLSKSTLQGYYPNRQAFIKVTEGKAVPYVFNYLDFSSSENFFTSWKAGLQDKAFKEIVRLFISNSISNDTTLEAKTGLKQLRNKLNESFSDKESDELIHRVMGLSVIIMMSE